METSKIQSVTKTDKTWNGQSGPMYDYVVVMDDSTTGTASSTSPESPPYAVGDEVEYTKTENSFGTKLRIKKAGGGFGGSGGGFKPNSTTQRNIENSWAIQTAVQILGHCAEDVTFDAYVENAGVLARILLLKRDNLN